MGNSETKPTTIQTAVKEEATPAVLTPTKEPSVNVNSVSKTNSNRIKSYLKFPKYLDEIRLGVEATATPQTASLQPRGQLTDSPQVLLSPHETKSPIGQSAVAEFVISYRKTDPEKADLGLERVQTEQVQTEEAQIEEGPQEAKLKQTIRIPPKGRRAALLQSKLSKHYSNSCLMEIKSILNAQLLNTKNPDQVLYEGEILKFRPGKESSSWIERWCKVTPTAFLFYNSDLNNQCYDVAPSTIVPISDILSVLRVNFDLTAQKRSQYPKKDYRSNRYKYKQVFQFEIFTEEEEYPYKEEIDCEIFNQNELEEEDKRRKARKLNQTQNLVSLSYRDQTKLGEYSAEKKFSETMPRIPKNNPLNRPVLTYRTYRKTRDSIRKSTRASNRDQLDLSHSQLSYPSKSPSSDKYRAGKDQEEDVILSAPRRDMYPIRRRSHKKAGYKWVEDLEDTASWSTKEREWYLSDKRMLFGCSNILEREKWLAVINWIVEKNTPSS